MRLVDAEGKPVLDALPTIDAVPVVRCRECKYLRQYNDKKETYFCANPRGIADPIIKKTGFAVTASRRKMRMNKKHIDMTPICDKCGKTAPINEKMSTPNWTVYMVKEPCECGGQFKAKFLLEKEADHD